MFSPSHCSSGHIGCSFENPGKIFPRKVWEFFAQYQKLLREQWQKTNFMGLVSLKLGLQFWQPCWKNSGKRPNCFSSICEDSKDNQLKMFYSIHCSSGHVGCSFKNPATTFNQTAKTFCSLWTVHGRKVTKKRFSSNSTSSHVKCFSATMPRSFHRKAKMF